MTIIQVPTINDTLWDFHTLRRIWFQATNAEAVRFEFKECRFLRQNAVAFLGGLVRLLRHRGVTTQLGVGTLEPAVKKNLEKNGFIKAFTGQAYRWSDNTIPYREDGRCDARSFQGYLASRWLGNGWVGVSDRLRDSIVERVAETYLNAFEHSASPVGVFTCGQYYPNIRQLNLSLVDFGVGIPSNVRLFRGSQFGPEPLSGAACMEWAFQLGTSTSPKKDVSRGIGLDLLSNFLQANGGSLEMMSHDGYVSIVDNKARFDTLSHFFEGTIVNICLQCDDKHYCLASENVPVVTF